jgi:diacylglycerol kinase family enzyme
VTTTRPVPKEAVLIVNAHSRKGQDLFREASAKLEMSGVRLIAAHAVKDPSTLNETVRGAINDGAPMVIVGGGDGSLSGTVDDVVDRDCVFALLPLGTANSFARTLGIPLDLDGAIRTIATVGAGGSISA